MNRMIRILRRRSAVRSYQTNNKKEEEKVDGIAPAPGRTDYSFVRPLAGKAQKKQPNATEYVTTMVPSPYQPSIAGIRRLESNRKKE